MTALQHDLKTKESRFPREDGARVFFWCICGRYYGARDDLIYGPIVVGFIAHLDDLASEVPKVNERGEWAR